MCNNSDIILPIKSLHLPEKRDDTFACLPDLLGVLCCRRNGFRHCKSRHDSLSRLLPSLHLSSKMNQKVVVREDSLNTPWWHV